MARRTEHVDLPSEVHVVTNKASGKKYYYWHPGRGTKQAGERVALPPNPQSKEFWAAVEALGGMNPKCPRGSVADVVRRYRDSEDFLGSSASTQKTYRVHLDRFADPQAWGLFPARDLTAVGVLAARDTLKDTPYMANQMLDVGRTLWRWAIPLGLVGRQPVNPFEQVKDLPLPDRGHVPWPKWVRTYVLEHAPQDLQRMVQLGLMTCQRESDLVRMGPQHREDHGIWCRPQKTRRKRRAFRIPLATADAFELDRWAWEAIRFNASRWKAPIARKRDDVYLYTPRGQPYTPDRLRARWGRWLATPRGNTLSMHWRAWLGDQVARYEWDIDPDDTRGPTIHGLRGAGVLIRMEQGFIAEQISNDIGMSLQMVERYTRFRDQIDVADAARQRLQVVPDALTG
jgi:integrase